jgi:hypothetical protein
MTTEMLGNERFEVGTGCPARGREQIVRRLHTKDGLSRAVARVAERLKGCATIHCAAETLD